MAEHRMDLEQLAVQGPAQALGDGVRELPLSAHLGLRFEGVALERGDAALFARIRQALLEYHVVSIGGQHLSVEGFMRFAASFGSLRPHTAREFHHPSHAEVLVLSNERRADGSPLGLQDGGTYWHTDEGYLANPCWLTVLYGLRIPAQGGDTLFTNMVRACQQLPPALRQAVEGATALHDYAHRPNRRPADAPLPPVEHPLLRPHPLTGQKALYTSPAYTVRVLGRSPEQSKALLRALTACSLQRHLRLRYTWQPGDVVLWDNAAVMHCATTKRLNPAHARTLWRTSVALN